MTAVEIPTARIGQWWNNTVVAAKTIVVILAIIGAAHVTAPMRAEAAPAAVVQPAAPAKAPQGK